MQTNASDIPRRWKRQPAKIPIRLVLKAEEFERDCSATIMDISLGGMSVKTVHALLPGEWVGVVTNRKFPHAIPTRAVWVREDESSHWTFAGLEFIDTLGV
jgi:c-di-GMP-binding flagellar brake protein YcgR